MHVDRWFKMTVGIFLWWPAVSAYDGTLGVEPLKIVKNGFDARVIYQSWKNDVAVVMPVKQLGGCFLVDRALPHALFDCQRRVATIEPSI